MHAWARAGTTDEDIRLAGLGSSSSGRVEVCKSGQWGAVCDDRWDDLDAQVRGEQAALLPLPLPLHACATETGRACGSYLRAEGGKG